MFLFVKCLDEINAFNKIKDNFIGKAILSISVQLRDVLFTCNHDNVHVKNKSTLNIALLSDVCCDNIPFMADATCLFKNTLRQICQWCLDSFKQLKCKTITK